MGKKRSRRLVCAMLALALLLGIVAPAAWAKEPATPELTLNQAAMAEARYKILEDGGFFTTRKKLALAC